MLSQTSQFPSGRFSDMKTLTCGHCENKDSLLEFASLSLVPCKLGVVTGKEDIPRYILKPIMSHEHFSHPCSVHLQESS